MKDGRLAALALTMDKPPIEFKLERVEPLYAVECRYIETVLASVKDNKTLAAKLLGISRKTLYRKLGWLKDLPAGFGKTET